MNEAQLADRIRRFVIEKFPLAKKKDLTDADNLLETGVVDSLGILEVVTFLENEFKLGVSDEDLVPENFQNITSIAAFVRSKTPSTFRSLEQDSNEIHSQLPGR
jgi:acyl carrier protein